MKERFYDEIIEHTNSNGGNDGNENSGIKEQQSENQNETLTVMQVETKQLLVLKPGVRAKLLEEYEAEALAHYNVCQYPASNVWRHFHLEEAEKVRPLKKQAAKKFIMYVS